MFPPVCTTAEAAKLVMSLAVLYLTVTDIKTYKTKQQRLFIFYELLPVYPGGIVQKHS